MKVGDTVSRPYAPQLINGVPPEGVPPEEGTKWRRELLSLEDRIREAAELLPDNGVVFCKEMAKFSVVYDFYNEAVAEDLGIELVHKHLLLIRDPFAVLSSWDAVGDVHGNNPTIDEVGMVTMLSIYSTLQSRSGDGSVALLDSDQLAADPLLALTTVCEELGFAFKESMMSWETGPHACDGPWADWWYADVHKSSGWRRNVPEYGSSRYRTLNPNYMSALKASYPAYEFLKSLTEGYRSRGPPPFEIYEDPRNERVLVWVGAPGRGRIIPRDMAGVSPWDSSVQGGDAAWEGLRVYRGKILSLEKHLRRLFKSAKALGFENVHSKEEIVEAIFRVLAANGMRDGAHMRLTLTRGEKCTSSMNPKFNVSILLSTKPFFLY
jgi:hypothetical protein